MKRPRRAFWVVFALAAGAVMAVMAWVTGPVLELETRDHRATAAAAHETRLRLALWRMDSWLGAILAVEAARPYTEYWAYHQPWTAQVSIGDPRSLVPSPLLLIQPFGHRSHSLISPLKGFLQTLCLEFRLSRQFRCSRFRPECPSTR